MKSALFVFLFSSGFQAHAAWNLNDVSYLMPLPEIAGTDSLLKVGDIGAKGSILPKLVVDRIPPLLMTSGRDEVDAALRVVAIRIDPCFTQLSPERCEKQIRFVWQPIVQGTRPRAVAADTALHSFYVLTDLEFSELRIDLQAWKQKHRLQTEGLPLQVLPILQNPTRNNQALKDLLSVFLKHTGLRNLTKVTAMVLRGGEDMWVFMQFDLIDGQLVSQPIPRLDNRPTQAFVNQVNPATSFGRVQVAPRPVSDDYFGTIVSSTETLTADHDPLIIKEMEILYRIENPRNFHANNMDCVSCHLAEPAKQWAQRARPHLNLQALWPQSMYQNARHNLQNSTAQLWSTHMLRGFGYFGNKPAISQRVINESAEVADQLILGR